MGFKRLNIRLEHNYILSHRLVHTTTCFGPVYWPSSGCIINLISKKGKAIPLQAWTGPEGSKRLRLPDFRQSAHEGGKVVSPTHQPPLPPGNISGTHFC